MSEKDKELIKKANRLSYIDWHVAYELAEEADTPEAREELRDIASTLYHKEEYYAGLL